MGYSKAETEKKQEKLVSKTQRNSRKILVIFFKIILVGIIAVIIAGAGAGFGMMKGILDNAPDVSNISIVPKGFRSNIYDKDGKVEKEISTIDSNRVYVYYDQIPKDFVNAFVAIEDARSGHITESMCVVSSVHLSRVHPVVTSTKVPRR